MSFLVIATIAAPNDWAWGWFACVLCMAFTLRCAFAFARKQPDIFLSLIVYAAQWGVLVVYYSELGQHQALAQRGQNIEQSELLPAIAGYLAAAAGFIIYRTHRRENNNEVPPLYVREELVALLLLLLAIPKVVESPFGQLLPGLTDTDIEVLVTVILDTIGTYSLYKAIAITHAAITRRLALGAPLIIYWCANASFVVSYVLDRLHPKPEPVVGSYLWPFAILKLLVVLTFVPAILAPYDPFKQLTWPQRLTHLIGAASGE